MSPRQTRKSPIQLGRGRPFSQEALGSIWQAIVSRNPATDWTKGRALIMVLTVMVVVWGFGGALTLLTTGPGEGLDRVGLTSEGTDDGSDGQAQVAGRTQTSERLQNDLFKVPKPRRSNKKKEPKTNPVELLRLIELQGVLGGANPRAMVMYKRTKESVTVSVGDDLGEFEVMEIRERSVILKWREELFELSL